MNLPEHIPQTEENIPLLAQIAVDQAYLKAKESGVKIITSENGVLVERSPNGEVRELKRLPASQTVDPSQSRSIR